MRIGVVADTHYPEFMDELPAVLFERLRGVDLILHAGDVGGLETLDRLRRIAPVEAVRGDHDRSLAALPLVRELDLEGHRVVVVHGNRTRLIEEPVTFLGTVTLGYWWPKGGVARALRRRFPDADLIVHGHTHEPRVDSVEGAVVLNPGAVYQVDREAALWRLARNPGWFEWSWLQVIRHRRRVPAPTVAVVELGSGPPLIRVLPLD